MLILSINTIVIIYGLINYLINPKSNIYAAAQNANIVSIFGKKRAAA